MISKEIKDKIKKQFHEHEIINISKILSDNYFTLQSKLKYEREHREKHEELDDIIIIGSPEHKKLFKQEKKEKSKIWDG